uniref:Zinc finger family protein n=1 Tax=Rhizophora mucronata TaxID=61149 RepID=A0A2P2KHP9_RHIMU
MGNISSSNNKASDLTKCPMGKWRVPSSWQV